MPNRQTSTISGDIYTVYLTTGQDYLSGRMPRIGQKACFEDGRKYVFCSTDANLVAGQIAGTAAEDVEMTSGSEAAAVGSKTITVVSATIGSAAANDYADGYILVSDAASDNVLYRVKSNTAAATNSVTFTLYDEVRVAITADDNVIVKKSRNKALIQGTASLDNVGVAVRSTTAATTGLTQYLWVQYAGVGTTVGTAGANGIALMATAAGAVIAQTAGKQIVANGLEVGAATSLCNLCFPEG